uniref:SH3 and PX domain-containing protein 2B-like n=1 Tax=Styela clava TaxID=7725 RepID=UPI001939E521|nr:SH3 and PX domain-containing protein 2B-like [Styela clava]
MALTIQDIRVKDIEKRKLPSKHYAYIIEVEWSNNTKSMIGRQYSAFFDFQMSLLELFPVEAGQRDPRQRQIPFLPGKLLFRRSNTREVALKRLRPIAEYCIGISKLPKHISESEVVVEFFTPTEEDKSTIRRTSVSPEKQSGVKTANEITGPVTFDKYIAIAEYTKENKKELSLKEGQVVEVVEKHENGWWLAANEEGMSGWVPGVYLESLYGETAVQSSKRLKPGSGEMYEAITDFKASSSDEMSFNYSDVVEVLEKNLEGWWYARRDDAEGWVPATYLEKSNATTTTKYTPTRVRPGFDAKAKWRKSIEKAKKPPPKRQTVRRTLTQAAAARVQNDFTAKMIKQESIIEEDDEEEFAGIYKTIASFDSTIPDGISFDKEQTVYVTQKS